MPLTAGLAAISVCPASPNAITRSNRNGRLGAGWLQHAGQRKFR